MDDIDNANERGSMGASSLLLASSCCECDRHCADDDVKAEAGADVKADTTIFPLPPLFGSVVIVAKKKSTRNHPQKEPTRTLFRDCMMFAEGRGKLGLWLICLPCLGMMMMMIDR